MKKIMLSLIVFITLLFHTNIVYAQENTIDKYIQLMHNLNTQYGTDLNIMSEEEFEHSDYRIDTSKTYNDYIHDILSMSKQDFEHECLNLIQSILTIKDISVNIDNTYSIYSTQSSKTLYFNNNCNSMTLTYKYTGSGTSKKFDTSFTPTVSVSVVRTTPSYFRMASYIGSFLNSNTSYKVTAKGSIYSPTGLVSNNASFNVTFNI